MEPYFSDMESPASKMARHIEAVLREPKDNYFMLKALSQRTGKDENWFSECVNQWSHSYQTAGKYRYLEEQADLLPQIRHWLWFTSSEHPSHPTEDLLKIVISQVCENGIEWNNIFWTNSRLAKIYLEDRFSNINPSINVKLIDEFQDHTLYTRLQDLISGRRYVLAGDLFRMMVINKFGGIYTDLGIYISQELVRDIRRCKYCVLLGVDRFFQSSLFASGPNSYLTNLMLKMAAYPYAMPYEIIRTSHQLSGTDEVNILAGPMLTALAMLFIENEDSVFIVAAGSPLLQWISTASWYGKPKFGNALLSEQLPVFLNDAMYLKRATMMQTCLLSLSPEGSARLRDEINVVFVNG